MSMTDAQPANSRHICASVVFLLTLLLTPTVMASEDWTLDDDELFDIDDSSLDTDSVASGSALKTTLSHSQTHGGNGDIANKRSRLAFRLEQSVDHLLPSHRLTQGLYARLIWGVNYYWRQDELATPSPLNPTQTDFGRSEWDEAWLQFSHADCATQIGRVKILWGEVEGTFAVDVVSPFDFTKQLFTDYSDLRLGQDGIALNCYFSQRELQWFLIHQARVNRQSNGLQLADPLHEEFGVRWKQYFDGFDISVMAAHLHDNQLIPLTLVPNGFGTAARQHLLGLSTSINRGQWLWKADASLTRQPAVGILETATKHDIAAGVEHVSDRNHRINAGIWYSRVTEPTASDFVSLTAGWDKTYWHDDLALSALVNYVDETDSYGATMLAVLQMDDYWKLSGAMAFNHVDDAFGSESAFPLTDGTEWTLKLTWQF